MQILVLEAVILSNLDLLILCSFIFIIYIWMFSSFGYVKK